MLLRLRVTIRSWFARSRLEREMREEMEVHLEEATIRLMARGLTRVEARREADREFGNLGRIQEQGRDARGARWIEAAMADIRFAIRQFRRTPLATATMVVVLALGIGANAGLFTVLHSRATMPPPGVARDDALVRIRQVNREIRSFEEVTEYGGLTDHFSGVVAAGRGEVVLDVGRSGEGTLPGRALFVTDGYFELLGIRPLIGTTLSEARSGGGADSVLVAVIGHGMWETDFGATPGVLGRTVKVNDVLVKIVGVAPPRFSGTEAMGYTSRQLWLPADIREIVRPRPTGAPPPQNEAYTWTVVARLQPGVTRGTAEAAVKVVAARAVERIELYRNRPPDQIATADIAPLLANNAFPYQNRDFVRGSALLGTVTLLILLITCTNVSALLVGIAVTRRREIAVRLSMGAPRRRIVRQLLTENVLRAVGAGVLGLLTIGVLLKLSARYLPDLQLALTWPTLLFTLGLAIATGIVFGLSPALHASRVPVAEVLKSAGPAHSGTRGRLQRGLVVAQIALTQPLLVALGGLILFAIGSLSAARPSPLEDRIVTVTFSRPNIPTTTREDADRLRRQRNAEFLRLTDRLASLPGVVGAVPHAEFTVVKRLSHIHPEDRVPGAWSDEPIRFAPAQAIVRGWLDMMGIPLVAGRDFAPLESSEDSAAIIIRSDMATVLWGDANPIGRRLQNEDGTYQVVVIGVVDGRPAGPAGPGMTPDGAHVFTSLSARAYYPTSVRLRTVGPAEEMLATIRRAASEEAPDLPIISMTTLAAERDEQRRVIMYSSGAAGAGGLLALFLSAIGLYALISLAVTQRRREIGIRTALGARRSQVIRMFFRDGLRLSLIGLAIGLPLGLLALRLLETYSDAPRTHFATLTALIAICVVGVASFASWLPARRAVAGDPFESIRDAT